MLSELSINDEIYFQDGEVFKVRAKGGKFLIATAEVSGSSYTIVDTEKGICGPNNLVFNSYDYMKQEDITKCLEDLQKNDLGISKRHQAKIKDVIDVKKTLNPASDEVEYDSSGRMKYHPDYHFNHGKSFTVNDLIYICQHYRKGNVKNLSLAVGRTEGTLNTLVTRLRKSGDFELYKNLEL